MCTCMRPQQACLFVIILTTISTIALLLFIVVEGQDAIEQGEWGNAARLASFFFVTSSGLFGHDMRRRRSVGTSLAKRRKL